MRFNNIAKIAVAAFLVLAILIGYQCYRNKPDEQNKKDVARSGVVEQQHTEQTAASVRVDTLVDTVYLHEKALTGSARGLRHKADIALPAGRPAVTIADSSAMWHLRWQLLGLAYDTLSEAKRLADLRADSLAADRSRWKRVADSAVAVMVDLRGDLARSQGSCRILPFIPCPSRKAVLITGLVVGAAGGVYIEQHRH